MVAACGVGTVDGLPLVEMAPPRLGEPLAIFMSGDGGWRAIDRRVAQGLNASGYGVVGLISPCFFARARTPEESAHALQRIAEHYTTAWRAPRVIVVGYWRGAGVLPFMVNRMTPQWRSRIAAVALIGLEPTIRVNESDSLCRQLSTALVTPIAEPGAPIRRLSRS